MPQVNHQGRVHAVQLLRALAAAVVAIAHLAFGFADHIGSGLGIPAISSKSGQVAVAVFFVVSGYIMVVSSRRLFGRADGRRIFLIRRCVRIFPTYWVATSALIAVWLVLLGRGVDPLELALSLALIPYWAGEAAAPLPLLWPGWTLFYEMVFYLLFGLGVARGRTGAVMGALAGIILLVVAGMILQPTSAILFSLTRPVMLVFVGGLVLGQLRESGAVLPGWGRWLAALGAVLAYVLVPDPAVERDLGFAYVAWAGLPAILLCVALLSGPLTLPAFGVIDRAGDASYALYLLHVPIAHAWMWAFAKVYFIGGAWGYLLGGIVITLVASWLFFAWVERPLTHWLNRHLGGTRQDDGLLQQSGV